MDALDLIISLGVSVVTERETVLRKSLDSELKSSTCEAKYNLVSSKLGEVLKTSDDRSAQSEILFNINPYYQFTVDMTNLGPKTEKPDNNEDWDENITTKDLDINEGKGYKIVDRKVGKYTRKKKILLPAEPIFSNIVMDTWNLFDILNQECPPSWRNVFKISYKQLCVIKGIVEKTEKEGKVLCPKKAHIFRAFELCPLSKVRVVIIGQDPYHTVYGNTPIANGLSFSVSRGTTVPPSLCNVYKELARSVPGFIIPEHGDLSAWALQGVLMLNVALTTCQGTANAHHKYWSGFTINTLHALNKLRPECIYVLWGVPSRKLLKHINNHSLVLQSRHPSPMSVAREYNAKDKFTANGHFVRINELLQLLGQKSIDWTL